MTDVERAIVLYEWNAQVSDAFHEILGLLEVTLRKCHRPPNLGHS